MSFYFSNDGSQCVSLQSDDGKNSINIKNILKGGKGGSNYAIGENLQLQNNILNAFGNVRFVGIFADFPSDAEKGWLAYVSDRFYLYDGSAWYGFGYDNQPKYTDPFLYYVFRLTDPDAYSGIGKADFLTYVFGSYEPLEYIEGGRIPKNDFISYIMED